jgi:uncharacterized cupin superfamily protein
VHVTADRPEDLAPGSLAESRGSLGTEGGDTVSDVVQGTAIRVVRSDDRDAWVPLVDPPGERGSSGREADVFSTAGGALTTGFWERDPDTWSFERPYDEVALILEGDADVITDDGRTLTVGPGDVLVTPKGSTGTWVIRERVVKFWVIYDG